MFQTLRPQPDDALLALIGLFRDDPRAGKIDLGVGTYRDESGETPILRVVKSAERILLDKQRTKAYLGPGGDPRFVDLLRPIVFGGAKTHGDRLAGVQTPGGGGGLRLGAELIALARPGARVWLATPTWPNHYPTLAAARLQVEEYDCFDSRTQSFCLHDMLAALSAARAGDVVLLHGCCHNPTGIDPDRAQWDEIAAFLARRDLVPFIDLAYQGLGRGLEPDAYGVRRVLSGVGEALVAYSCDKNFGLYRERTGALFVLASDAASAGVMRGNMLALARVNWSMPPDHGAAIVRTVLESVELTRAWEEELGGMCRRINSIRHALAAAAPPLAFLAGQCGMFAQMPIDAAAIAGLRRDHAIYMAGSGRANLAGLRAGDVDRFVAALREAGAFAGPRQRAAFEAVA